MDTSEHIFDYLCRTCLNELAEESLQDANTKPQQQWLSIFDIIEEECGAFRIAELLTNAVPQIEVELSDEFPKQICCKCLQQLLSVHRFQQICVQSEQQMRQQLSKKRSDLEIAMKGEAMEGDEAVTNDTSSYSLISLQLSTTHQNVEHISIQKPLETTEQLEWPEAAEASDVDPLQCIEQSLEDGRDSQGNLSEIIKNEPIEDDQPSIEYSDGDTMQSIISVKDEVLAIESEKQQINKRDVKKRNSRHGEDKPYECPYCPLRFKTSSSVHHHKAIHEGVKREICDICGKSIAKKDLKHHKLSHSNEKAHKCDSCAKSFTKKSLLRIHMRKHTGEKPYKCKYCESSFTHSTDRLKHMRVHLGDKVHRCELCPLAFALVSELRLHFTTHKNEAAETRERNMKALKETEAKLEANLRKKACEQPLEEETQPQIGTKATESNKAHRITHGEDKPYECPHCPRKFDTKPHMLEHTTAVHAGGERRICDICGKSISKKNLKQHKLNHSDEKAHKCYICDKRFARNSFLRIHMRKHTGEKPYKCQYCGISFTYGGDRIRHMRLHLGDNVYRCELCPLAFPAALELRNHLTTHKNEDPETHERNMKALKEAEAKLQLKFRKKDCEQSLEEESHSLEEESQPLEEESQPLEEGSQPLEEESQSLDEESQPQFATKVTENAEAHRNTQVDDQPYEGPHCSLILDTKPQMLEHKAIHADDTRATCNVCGKSILKKNLKQHKLTHSDEKAHKCHLCEKSFARNTILRIHIRTHTGEKPYKCKYCGRSFSDSSSRRKHMRCHLGANIHRCKLCPLAFPAASELHAHFVTHENEDPETRERNVKALKEAEAELQQKFSQHQFDIKAENISEAHLITHVEDKPYECPQCSLIFDTKPQMLEHKAIHAGDTRAICNICGKSTLKRNLKQHKLTHSDEKAHKCHLCEKSFARKTLLRIHIRTHTGEKPYKCKYCLRNFSQNSVLRQHMSLHFGRNVYRCKLCPLAFPAASELRAHLPTHENEDPETCERNMKALMEAEAELQQKFSQHQFEINAEMNVKAHRIIHGEDKPYECPYCPRRFHTNPNMLHHKAIHEGFKREACDICGKSITKYNLKQHKRSHSTEKAYKCDLCEKRFVQISHLRSHIRKHTGEKPYKCKYCESSFAESTDRLKHMRFHLGDNVHRCELCPLAFPVAAELRAHFTTHKNEDPETRERNMKALEEAEAELQLKVWQQQDELNTYK